ncbi:MAG TPA: hypothetical protein VLB84_08970, partial [Bacteroidia bacterium]|nr:hypothetical protein [Bacteroidia bacterium]
IFLYSKALIAPYPMIRLNIKIEDTITPILPTTLIIRVMATFSLQVKKQATINKSDINNILSVVFKNFSWLI